MQPALPPPPPKVRRSVVERSRRFVLSLGEFAFVIGAVLYIVGSWVARRYYDRFALSPSEVGVTQFDLMLTAAGLTIVVLGFVAIVGAISWLVSRVVRRDSRRSAEAAAAGRPVLRLVHYLPTSFVVALLVLLLASYFFFAGTPGHAADDTKAGEPATPWLSQLPEPRGVRLRDAQSDCMILLATHEGVWMIWNVEEQQLERYSTDSDVLISCSVSN